MAEPPGPIPNPEVKRRSADGSGAIGPVRVGRRQVFARPCLNRQGRALFLPGWRTLLDEARCVADRGTTCAPTGGCPLLRPSLLEADGELGGHFPGHGGTEGDGGHGMGSGPGWLGVWNNEIGDIDEI